MIERVESWPDAFSSFVESKTRSAIAAILPPYRTIGGTLASHLIAVGNAWTASHFDGPFYMAAGASGRPVCSLVFVQSADRNTVADDPASLGGGQTDKHVVYEGLSRVTADGVLAGAETVRGGGAVFSVWHPELVDLRRSLRLPRHPMQVIATLRGVDLERGLLFNVPEVPVAIITIPIGAAAMATSVASRPWIRMITMEHAAELPHAFHELRALGVLRLSCVGGRTLATQLLDLGLVDDVYLTTAPRPGGVSDTPMYPRRFNGTTVVRKHGTAQESGVVFEHVHCEAGA